MNERPPVDPRPAWPYASLFFFGFFGTRSPEGKELAWRTTGGLALFLTGGAFAQVPGVGPLVAAIAMAGAVVWIGWAYARYLRRLDELSRAIQLQAFAVAYLAAMVLMTSLLAMQVANPPVGAPGAVWIVLAEPIRGVALVVFARRFR